MDQAAQHQALLVVEKACIDFQNPVTQKAAEKVLLEFRKIPGAVSLCRYILDHTSLPLAQFQAVTTLREAVIRDWLSLSLSDKLQLRSYLLDFVLAKRSEAYVEKLLLQTAALMTKRGWFDGDQASASSFKESLFGQLSQILEHPDPAASPEQRSKSLHVAMVLLASLVDEFTYTKSNNIGLTWEFHHACAQSFQKGELRTVFLMAISQLRSAIHTPGHLALVKDSLNLAVQVLCWKFEEPLAEKFSVSFRPQFHSPIVKPGPCWREAFIDGDTLSLLFQMYPSLRSQPELAHSVLVGLTQLASLSGSVFATDDSRLQYLHKLITGLISLLRLPGPLPRVAEVQGFAQIALRITSNFKLVFFLTLSDVVEPFFAELATFTCKSMQMLATAATDSDTRTELEECVDTLLEAWVVLLNISPLGTPGNAIQASPEVQTKITAFAQQFTSRIFHAYTEARLTLARAELDAEDDDEDEDANAVASDEARYEDQLAAVSFLGRLEPAGALNSLTTLLDACTLRWRQFIQQREASGVNIGHVLEEIHWLLLLSGHVIADSYKGEDPGVPEPLNRLSTNAATAETDALVVLINKVLALIQLETDQLKAGAKHFLSPLLGRTFVWFLDRWCRTYLALDVHVAASPRIKQTFAIHGPNGLQMFDFCLRKLIVNFEQWEGETALLLQSCALLKSLSRIRFRSSSANVMSLQSWQDLLAAHVNDHPALLKFPPEVQRLFIEGFTTLNDAACPQDESPESVERRAESFRQGVEPLRRGLTALLQRPDFVKIAESPATIVTVTNVLERFRGLTRALLGDDRSVFDFCAQFFPAFVGLVEVYKNHSHMVVLVLLFYRDLAEFQSENLDEAQAKTFFSSIIELFRKYSACSLGRTRTLAASHQASAEKEVYKDVVTLLKLLCILSGLSNTYDHAQEIIFFGISIVLPFITSDLLGFPKLCKTYFQLVNLMFEDCPYKLAVLPPELFKNLLTSVEYGVNHHDVDIARISMDALAAMARFNYTTQIETGTPGLHSQLAANPPVLREVLRFVLHFVLFSDFSADLVTSASDALLPLICSEQQAYREIVGSFIESQVDPQRAQRLAAAFTELMSTNNLSLSLDRKNISTFQKNVQQFLNNVKSFLLAK
eukprot:TRINITY_DN299_c0_g4_i1.p1 TRINITY_DN299_c0_g4~~TRINITY_DN299_c0_g4_i1.p1  ORF type:complete len:1128 (-),score=390.95 TRINITY_DN299_c0_g4_i1:363-3746(-)